RSVGYAGLGALVVTGTGWLVLHRPVPAAPADNVPALGSATVVRTNVTAHDIVTGSLGYLDPVSVVAGAMGGGLTRLPAPGPTNHCTKWTVAPSCSGPVPGRPGVTWYPGCRPDPT